MSTSATQAATDVRARYERANVACLTAFALNGLTFATWAGRIPTTQSALDLTPGELGMMMLAGSTGSLIGLPLAGRISGRFGAARTVLVGAILSTVALAAAGVTVGVAHSTVLTAVALFVMCMGLGQWDVAMNLEGAHVEQELGRTIMPRYHAAFSIGTVFGALAAAALAATALPQLVHFWVAALVILGGTVWAVRSFTLQAPVRSEENETAAADAVPARSAWTEPRTLLIGLVTLVAAFTEGTANDWVSVAFIRGYNLPEWAGVLGFATFLTFMTIGRFFGTNLVDKYERVAVLRVLFALAGVGSLLLVFGGPTLAFIGAAVWGFGVSLGFPLGMSAAADDPARAPMRVSVVATIAYAAFLVGPPALGFLGDHVGILRALSVVSFMVLFAYLALPAMKKLTPEEVAG